VVTFDPQFASEGCVERHGCVLCCMLYVVRMLTLASRKKKDTTSTGVRKETPTVVMGFGNNVIKAYLLIKAQGS
jgi:hypothetical protein